MADKQIVNVGDRVILWGKPDGSDIAAEQRTLKNSVEMEFTIIAFVENNLVIDLTGTIFKDAYWVDTHEFNGKIYNCHTIPWSWGPWKLKRAQSKTRCRKCNDS